MDLFSENRHLETFWHGGMQPSQAELDLFKACRDKDLLQIQKALQNGAPVNAKHSDRWAPLHFALHHQHLDWLPTLFKAGADVNLLDANHRTPLHYATQHGLVEIVDQLLELGADPHLKTKKGDAPLIPALLMENIPLVQRFLSLGVDFQRPCDLTGETPLHLMIQQHKWLSMTTLIEYGADLESRSRKGLTPLLEAGELTIGGEGGIATQILLRAGVDLEAQNPQGWTALHYAVANNTSSLMLLIEAGANLEACDSSGKTPLLLLAHSHAGGRHALRAKILLQAGARIDAAEFSGMTPLHYAANNKHSNLLSLFMDAGANPLFVNTQQQKPEECGGDEQTLEKLRSYRIHFEKQILREPPHCVSQIGNTTNTRRM